MTDNDNLRKFVDQFVGSPINRPSFAKLDLSDGDEPIPVIATIRVDANGELKGEFREAGINTHTGHRLAQATDSWTRVSLQTTYGRQLSVYITELTQSESVKPPPEDDGQLYNDPVEGTFTSDQYEFRLVERELRHATFFLPNFPSFQLFKRSRRKKHGDTSYRIGWTSLLSDQWGVTVEEIRPQPVNSFTHHGHIARTDGNLFDIAELKEFLQLLRSFFSFVGGETRVPSLVTAVDSDLTSVWGCIGLLGPSKREFNHWFYRSNGEGLPSIFFEFTKLYETTPAELTNIVNYYSESQFIANSHLDVIKLALTASFSGLESCAQLILMRAKPREEDSRDFVRKALHSVQLGLPIKDLNRHIDFISDQRNAYIHVLVDRLSKSEFDDYYRAWELSQWLLELTLLKQMGYEGRYFNRVTMESSMVPWLDNC